MCSKNYLLVMPKLVNHIGESYTFPLGIAYVSSSLKKAGFNVYTINLNHTDNSVENCLSGLIKRYDIDVVATGGQSFQYNSIKEIVDITKKNNNETITIVGGGIITADPYPAMQALSFVDYGIVGEGEVTIVELCKALENSFTIEEVNGIIYRDGDNKYKQTADREEIENLDSIPWPDYEGFDFDKYINDIIPTMISSNKRGSLFMLTSRSCPFNCTFCFHTTGQTYRQRPLNDVFAELEFMLSKYNIKFIYFVDELFGGNYERLKEFCERIKKYNIKWWSEFRVDSINLKKIKLLKSAGCSIMTFGLESADNRILKSMRKGITIEQIEKTLELVYSQGISTDGSFIFGDVEETYETAMNTIKWWRSNLQYNISLGPISVYPGTYLYHYAVKQGIINDKVKFLQNNCPQINVSKMTNNEFAEIIDIISAASLETKKYPKNLALVSCDYKLGEIGLKGTCIKCGYENFWDKIVLFKHASIICEKCGQRYDTTITDEMKVVAADNMNSILENHQYIGLWGINNKVIDLLKSSHYFHNEKLVLIDISTIKQNMTVEGKKIYSPKIIDEYKILTIIIGVPFLFSNIESQIRYDYKNVNSIKSICELFVK